MLLSASAATPDSPPPMRSNASLTWSASMKSPTASGVTNGWPALRRCVNIMRAASSASRSVGESAPRTPPPAPLVGRTFDRDAPPRSPLPFEPLLPPLRPCSEFTARVVMRKGSDSRPRFTCLTAALMTDKDTFDASTACSVLPTAAAAAAALMGASYPPSDSDDASSSVIDPGPGTGAGTCPPSWSSLGSGECLPNRASLAGGGG
mmetsp:Transcript_4763/g.16992  ORF Transcript_4763/g.16992 Transcript_4763/m.16992 type:complete len:206 (-) Transcript_4763:1287-1904(-)